jgi:hypothetical protein
VYIVQCTVPTGSSTGEEEFTLTNENSGGDLQLIMFWSSLLIFYLGERE